MPKCDSIKLLCKNTYGGLLLFSLNPFRVNVPIDFCGVPENMEIQGII